MPYSPKCLEKLSEKSRRCVKRGLPGHRSGTIRPVSAPIYRPNPPSERCSHPFSDSFFTAFSEVRMRRFLAYKAILASVDLLWLSRQRSEGGSLLRSAQDTHRVPGLEPQVRPGVSYHPLAPHDRQH